MNSASIGNLLRRPEMGAFLGMIFVAVFFTVFGGALFLSPQGIASWTNVAANLGIIAVPIGFLMIAGELDISIGAMVPASSMCIGVLSGYYGLPISVGIIVTLAFGAVVGFVNGVMVIRTAVPSLIITMGTLFSVAGLMLFLSVVLTKTTSVSMIAPEWAKAVFGSYIGSGFQVMVLWWLGLTALYFFCPHGETGCSRSAAIRFQRATPAFRQIN
jgi:simple sugar transport system permease protein